MFLLLAASRYTTTNQVVAKPVVYYRLMVFLPETWTSWRIYVGLKQKSTWLPVHLHSDVGVGKSDFPLEHLLKIAIPIPTYRLVCFTPLWPVIPPNPSPSGLQGEDRVYTYVDLEVFMSESSGLVHRGEAELAVLREHG